MNSIIDYLGCILIRLLGPLLRALPENSSLFLGRRLGDLIYSFDLKHKAIAYANIKAALGAGWSPLRLSLLTKEFYRCLGQDLIEIFFMPLVNQAYIAQYVQVQGLQHVGEGLRQGKGVILLGMHAGSWELSNIICANLGFPFVLLVRDQKYPRLNKLLNSYRRQKGCIIVEKLNQTRLLIEALKNNQAVGMTADQGGRSGVMVKFFGREASMSSGAVRLALKYGAALIPAFYARVKGPSIKMIIGEPFELKKTADSELDIQENLQRLIPIFEGYIREYPQEYLWTYKIWKYGRQKNILILDDGKTGHLRQSQAAAAIAAAHFKEKGIDVKIETLEIKFKSGISRSALNFSSCLAGKYHCQGCLWCLRSFLKEDAYRAILAQKPDVVVSCGSSVAPVNFVVSRENMAKSVVIMRPSFLSTNRFDLVVMPRHDHPPRRKNIVVTEGALNLIDDEYLQEKSKELIGVTSHKRPEGALSPQGEGSRVASKYLGLLLGGDSKSFRLDTEIVREVIRQLKKAAQDLNAEILVTTSRRTPAEVEALVKSELKDYSRCKLLVIANEKNIPSAVGGILGLSRIVVVTPESISMVSESASSGKHTLVFKAGVSPKHRHFLKQLSRDNYIHYVAASGIAARIEEILQGRFQAKVLSDSNKVKLGLSRII